MEYDEIKAQEIIKKFGLSDSTLKVWKSRGKIPSKYLKEGFIARRVAETPEEKTKYSRGLSVLQNSKLNTLELCRITGVEYRTVVDAFRKGVNLDYNTFINLLKELQRFRIEIKKTVDKLAGKDRFSELEKSQMDRILVNDLFVLSQLFGYEFRKEPAGSELYTAYQRVGARQGKRSTVHENWEVLFAIDKLSIFLLETSV